jgi:hypothetical protein
LLSLNATVPPSGVGDTVALKVTDWPVVDGFTDEVNEVEVGVAAAVMLYGVAAEVDPPIMVALVVLAPLSSPMVGTNEAV